MSYSIAVPGPAPDVRKLLNATERALGLGTIHCAEELADGFLPDGYFHLYLPFHSTRGVEVSREPGETSFRILTCCSAEDHRLAIALADRTAALVGAETVEPEDTGPIASAELLQVLDEDWVAQMTNAGVGMLAAMIEHNEHEELQLFGWSRAFHMGPRTLARIRAQAGSDDDAALTEALMRNMQRLMLIGTDHDEEDGAYPASVMQAAPAGADEDDEEALINFTVWAPGVWYLFPPCEYFALIPDPEGEDEMPIFIPRDAIYELVSPAMIELLDEAHLRVDAIEDDEWPAFLERASAHRVELL